MERMVFIMTRAEYLDEFRKHLSDLSEAERNLAVKFYEEYFDEAGEENEERAMSELGKPYQLAKSVLIEQSAYTNSDRYKVYKQKIRSLISEGLHFDEDIDTWYTVKKFFTPILAAIGAIAVAVALIRLFKNSKAKDE